jgi:hypothetical protein
MAAAPATNAPVLIIDIILITAKIVMGCEASHVPVTNIDCFQSLDHSQPSRGQ